MSLPKIHTHCDLVKLNVNLFLQNVCLLWPDQKRNARIRVVKRYKRDCFKMYIVIVPRSQDGCWPSQTLTDLNNLPVEVTLAVKLSPNPFPNRYYKPISFFKTLFYCFSCFSKCIRYHKTSSSFIQRQWENCFRTGLLWVTESLHMPSERGNCP